MQIAACFIIVAQSDRKKCETVNMNAPDQARRVIRVSGTDSCDFLQNLVTNDINRISEGLLYAALLTPQGKYLFDFFLKADANDILIDIGAEFADSLIQRLQLYRLRAQVELAITDMSVTRGIGTQPPNSLPDPRCPELGWRHYGKSGPPMPQKVDWEALRIKHCVPESGIELISGESFILEVGFERLHGVDFRKGCYVGQEVTARMKHKTTLRKELRTVLIEGSAPVGTTITAQGRNVGNLFSQAGGQALALLRRNRISDRPMKAADARIILT